MSTRARLLGGLAAVCAATAAAPAVLAPAPALAADGSAAWISAPAENPPTPTGAQPSPYPLPLGYVGDIEFWAPNRGLLITAGNPPPTQNRTQTVPEGVYAYDGVTWHELSTVCGGSDGRIAFAGPDDFWTIADQRPGQTGATENGLEDLSLCHFLDGQVVASYAMPVGLPDSYTAMNAAACAGPDDCWFGGEDDSGGAFHLYWNGSALTQVDGGADHEIASMALYGGQLYETVDLSPTDQPDPAESSTNPPLLHLIDPADTANPFHDQFLQDQQGDSGHPGGAGCPTLPEYGGSCTETDIDPTTLNGLSLGSDYLADPTDPELWAAAGPTGAGATPPFQSGEAGPIVLRYAGGQWTQVVPNQTSLPGGDEPIGSNELTSGFTPSPQLIAPEPGEAAAWLAVVPAAGPDSQAHVDRIATDGTTGATVTDQDVLGDAQGVGPRGNASAIACPAAQDCWVATDQGWLFHLTNGTQYPALNDPSFENLITFRPPDASVPVVEPAGTIEATTVPPPPSVAPITTPVSHGSGHARPLVTHESRPRLIHGTTLVLSFTLTARARVQLVAKRRHRVVAETRRQVLKAGRHTLELKLNPRRYPTALALDAKSAAGR